MLLPPLSSPLLLLLLVVAVTVAAAATAALGLPPQPRPLQLHVATKSCTRLLGHIVRRDGSIFDRAEIAFISLCIYWNNKPIKEKKKSEYPIKSPDDQLQKMPYTKDRKIKSQTKFEPALWYWNFMSQRAHCHMLECLACFCFVLFFSWLIHNMPLASLKPNSS